MPRVASSNALAAPDCAGVELGRYLRRHTMTGTLDANDAQRAFETFRTLGLETYPTGPLLAEAFALRENVAFDDGLYIALARRLSEPLATTDTRLARAAAGLGVVIATPE